LKRSGWVAVFALETLLYVVGTAFIVLALSPRIGTFVFTRLRRRPTP
jgi:hypothetical protein